MKKGNNFKPLLKSAFLDTHQRGNTIQEETYERTSIKSSWKLSEVNTKNLSKLLRGSEPRKGFTSHRMYFAKKQNFFVLFQFAVPSPNREARSKTTLYLIGFSLQTSVENLAAACPTWPWLTKYDGKFRAVCVMFPDTNRLLRFVDDFFTFSLPETGQPPLKQL